MQHTFTIVGAAAALTTAPVAFAALTLTSAERSVRSHVEWTALFEADSATEAAGPVNTFGQWDAVADANPTDPIDWGNRVITEQHSFIGPTAVSAEMSVDVSSWPNRPSLGYVTLESENVFDFAFTITEPTQSEIHLVCDAYTTAAVNFSYMMQRVGGGFLYFGNNIDDYGPYGSPTGFSFDGILLPGDYVFTSTASFLLDFQPNAIIPQSWDATFTMTAVPAPGALIAFGLGAAPCAVRKRRST